MTPGHPNTAPWRPQRGAPLWATSLALVLALHAGAVAMLLRQPPLMPLPLPSAPEAVLLDLPPEPPASEPAAPPLAPLLQQTPLPPPPSLPEPVPPPPEIAPFPEPPPPVPEPPPPEPPPLPEPPPPEPLPVVPPAVVPPAVVLPQPPPPPPPPKPVPARPPAPRPVPRPMTLRQEPPVSPAASPVPAPVLAPTPVAPSAAAPASSADPTWRTEVSGKLARAKRYPDASRSRGEQGTAYATFTVDRTGHVLAASIVRGSGSYLLDEEAVALIHRAEPLPPMPPSMQGATVTLTVPIAFTLH